MKTTSVGLVAITLLISSSSFTEASKKSAAAPSKKGNPPQRINRLESEVQTRPRDFVPNHVLFDYKSYSIGIPANAISYEDALKGFNVESDGESLKSISENEVEHVATSSSSSAASSAGVKRKRIIEMGKSEAEAEEAAVNVLLSLSHSGGSEKIFNEEEETSSPAPNRRIVVRKAIVPKAPKTLLEMSELTFFNARINNFRSYFDGRNMQTAGNAALFKCFSFSHFFKLAAFLIEHGARFPEDPELLTVNFSAVVSGGVDSETSAKILMELLKYDPIGTVQMFVKIAGMMEKDIASDFDTFFISLLMDHEVAFLFFAAPSVPEVVQLLSASELFPESLNYICSHFEGVLDHQEVLLPATVKAVNSGNAGLIETFLEKGWIRADDKIQMEEGKSALTLISHLFGKLDSQKILRLIRKFDYPLSFSHNHSVNPEGDILIAAAMGKDLESFKRLLAAGASANVQMNSSPTTFVTLERIISNNTKFPGFLDALKNFQSGTLNLQIEAEDAAAFDAAENVFELTEAVGGDNEEI